MKKNGIALAIILIILVMTLVACGENDLDTCEHNVVIDEAVSATCTEMGLTEGAHCSKCGEVLLAQTEVPALGHTAADAVKENEIARTCTTAGSYDSVVYCSVCDAELSRETTYFFVTGHTQSEPVVENVVEPTCTTAGSYDSVVYCSVCDAELSRETKSVDALDHNIVNHNAQAPTCTEVGWEAYETCSRCDYTTYAEIPATGHTYSSDCDVICNVCEYERVSSVNHTYSSDCDTICNDCGATRITTTAHSDANPADNSCDVCGERVSTLIFTLSGDGQSYAITGATSNISGDITLPSTYNGKPVTTIGYEAFAYCDSLTSIVIPDSVTTIGEWVFYRCDSLTSVTIGDSVTTIGDDAFGSCTSLTGVYYTGDIAGWSGISFGSNSANPMYYADNLYIDGKLVEGELIIPDSVAIIGSGAFYNCISLTSITIPDSVTTIGSNAFLICTSLTSVTIGNGVTTIGDGAFGFCTSLTSVTIGDSVTTIGEGAFYECTSLTSIVIPDSVTTIGEDAFYRCTSLTSVTIGDSVTSIGGGAFSGCTSLTYNVYDNGKYLGNGSNPYLVLVEATSTSITSCKINAKCKFIHSGAFRDCSSLTSVNIDNSVTTIGSSAFARCTRLTSIVIPDSVTTIGDDAFYDCTSLTSISVDENNPNYKSIDGNLYSKDGKTLIQYAIGKTATSFVIPDSVTTIGSYAFYYCTSLTSVVISDSVTTIGDDAFSGCRSLTDVYYTGDIAGWCGISFGSATANPMYYADNLYIDGKLVEGELIIPDTVTSIGGYAFYNCTSLTSITIPDSVTSIGSYAFYNCTSLTSITLPFVGATKDGTENTHFGYIFGASSYDVPISLKEVVVTGGTRIGYEAFRNCTSLTSIVIPDSVTTIGYDAFSGCDSLTDVYYLGTLEQWCGITFERSDANPMYYADNLYIDGKLVEGELIIPDSVTSIGGYAFYNCTGLTSIVIPDSVTSIGYDAFSGCTSLTYNVYDNGKYLGNESNPYLVLVEATSTSITSCEINENCKVISAYAFALCSSLTSIVIPEGVTTIGPSAFEFCSSLTSIVIPDSVTTIGSYAFRYCDSLTSIVIPDSVTTIGEWTFAVCTSLTSIVIPDSVTTIGECAFWNCRSLTSVTFEDPNGWHVTNTQGDTYRPRKTLTDPSTSAEYLTDTYLFYDWYKE